MVISIARGLCVCNKGFKRFQFKACILSKLTSIHNIGPAMAALLEAAGYDNAEQVHRDGADVVYGNMLAAGAKAHFIPYYALVLGLMGRPWNNATDAEKVAFRSRFDAIKAAHKDVSLDPDLPADLAIALDHIGVRTRPRTAPTHRP
jgi:hypothetical protein